MDSAPTEKKDTNSQSQGTAVPCNSQISAISRNQLLTKCKQCTAHAAFSLHETVSKGGFSTERGNYWSNHTLCDPDSGPRIRIKSQLNCFYSHPLLQATYTGVRTTVLGNIFSPSFLAKTKREQPLSSHIHCKFWPHSLQFAI